MSQSNQQLERQRGGAVSRIEPVTAMEPIVPVYDLAQPNSPESVSERRRCAQALTQRINALKESGNCFVLSPFTNLDILPPGWMPTERAVKIDVESDRAKDTWNGFFCKEGEVALTKQGILKIWQAAGGTVIFSRQVDDRSHPWAVEWSCEVELRQVEGTLIRYPGSKRIDLRDGSPELQGMVYRKTEKGHKAGDPQTERIRGAREHIVTQAETKALLRAMRGALILDQTYLKNELRVKPFVVYGLAPLFDMSNPVVAGMVTAAQLGQPIFGPNTGGLPVQIGSGEPQRDIGALQELPGDDKSGEGDDAQAQTTVEPAEPVGKAKGKSYPAPVDDDVDLSIAANGEEPIYVCGCPCGHQVDIGKEQYDLSMNKLKSSRCPLCYPGRFYDEEPHAHLATLELAAAPQFTPAQAVANKKRILAGLEKN